MLMKELQVPVEKFRFEHYLELRAEEGRLQMIGKNAIWQNFSFVKEVLFEKEEHGHDSEENVLLNSPVIDVPSGAQTVTLKFYGDKF